MTVPLLIAVIFSTPLAALAVAGGAAAVPVIIHLLNRKRFQIIPWAAMRFLLAAQKKNVRRLRVEQWILLAIRILIGVLIVAAMTAVMKWAEPLWQRIVPASTASATHHGRTHRIIVIDGSYSMAARGDDDAQRFEIARAQAKAVLDRAGPGDGFSVVFLTSPAQTSVPGPADDRHKVADEIDELKLPHGSADVAGGLRIVADMVNRPLGKYARREVTFITDLKKSSWPLPRSGANLPAPAEISAVAPAAAVDDTWKAIANAANLVFIDVANQDVDNLAITNLELERPLPLVNAANGLKATIQNHGKHDRKDLAVELRVGQAPKPGEKLVLKDFGTRTVNVPAGGTVTVTFALEREKRFREAGEHIIQVKAGEDALRLDDVRSLAVTVRETIPVLVVNGKIGSEPFDTPGEWVNLALKPGRSGEKLANCPAQPTLVNAGLFADRFRADLTKFDCVFLCDLASISGAEVERLEAHLRRGGSVVIGLGPNAARHIDDYNRLLFNEGKGILPGRLLGMKHADGESYFTLYAEKADFEKPPLKGFSKDEERAAFTKPQFHQYVRLEMPATSSATRILSFLQTDPKVKADALPVNGAAGLDPAVIDFPRHRGHVIIYTSTFNPERLGREQFWSAWPLHPTFLPFWNETLRYVVAESGRHNLSAGELIEEYLPPSLAGLSAKLIRCDHDSESEVESAEIVSRDESALIRFNTAPLSGIYRVTVGSEPDRLFAVNVPTTAPGGGAEGDLQRLTIADLQASAPDADIQLVTNAAEVQPRAGRSDGSGPGNAEDRDPRGPTVAKFLLMVVLALIVAEVFFAWRYGSARAAAGSTEAAPSARRRVISRLILLVPVVAAVLVLGTILHAAITGEFLGFLPNSWRQAMERWLGVPSAAPGEGTRWRLEAMAYFTGVGLTDRWIVGGLMAVLLLYVWAIYRRERVGYPIDKRHRFLRNPLVALAALRIGLILVALLVLLPQLRLTFEREGWPDVVLVFDDSRSMATVEPFHDPVLREKAEELKKAWAELARPRIEKAERRCEEIRVTLRDSPSGPNAGKLRDELASLEKKITDWRTPHRLNLIKALVASGSQDWLRTFVRDRQMRVHLFRASAQTSRFAELSNPEQCARMLEEIIDIVPEGESSRLGDAVGTVLKTFRGGSLNAIVMFTDGQTTHGEDLPQAARLAARKGVPLYLVGVGDNQPPPDIALSDLKAERVINEKDRLMLEFRLTAQGPGMPDRVPVNLFEIVDGKRVRRNDPREPSEYAVNKTIRLSVTPDTPGDKEYVIEVPVQPGEVNRKNNRLEHDVLVARNQRVRVLFIESVPRYEYRFIKTLFERETEKVLGNKSIELSVYRPGASVESVAQDKSAIPDLPGWNVLKTYDVIILGDVNPKQFPREHEQLKLIADFVKERGGGLLVIAGEHFTPVAYAGTDLGDILPVITEGVAQPPPPSSDDRPLGLPYRPRLTSMGQNHPIFRFVADDVDNAKIWDKLTPMFWYAKGYRRKLSAEVLAVHPERQSEVGPGGGSVELHPLVLQQFVGAGRVMFFGFDETWRWRYRLDEARFNQFWVQTIRSLARARVGQVEVRVERRNFRRDEPIRITVRFPDDAPPRPVGEVVRIDVERRPLQLGANDGGPNEPEVQTIQLSPKEGSRGTFEALLTRTPEGEYRFVLAAPEVSGRKPKAEATVLPPKGELEDIRQNAAHLQQAATESHGVYYSIDKADQLPEELPNGPRVALDQPCDPIKLWNHPLMFALVFSLLAAEWVLRKRARLL
jgi:hypothetical protein